MRLCGEISGSLFKLLQFAYELCLRHFLARAQAAGILNATETSDWVAAQEARHQNGRCFLGWALFTFAARKP